MAKDLRYIRTEKNIKKAFLQLLQTTTYEKIKINDIIALAEISRNAFYLHYYSKDELLDSMIDEFAKQFIDAQNDLLQKYQPPRPTESALEFVHAILHPFFEDRKTSEQLLKIDYVIRRLADQLADFFYNSTDKSQLTEKEQLDLKMYAEYRAYGLFGMLGFVFTSKLSYTETEMAKLLHSINTGEALISITPFTQRKATNP